jgi:hypothetical protein
MPCQGTLHGWCEVLWAGKEGVSEGVLSDWVRCVAEAQTKTNEGAPSRERKRKE